MFSNLRGDIFGGITAGIVALPLALAFGVYSGMGAAAGLYGAIALGFFAALLGGTNTQVSGPTGPMSVISAVVISNAVAYAGGLDSAMGIILVTFLLAGLFQIGLGFAGIGQYIRYIPYPVISGFMTGIGLIIIILQVYPLMGAQSPHSTFDVIVNIHHLFDTINWYSLGLGLGTIAIIYLFPLITKLVPSTLIALLVTAGASMFWNMPVPTIGEIPESLPALQLSTITNFPFFTQFHLVLVPALTLAALGVIDSLLTSVVADNLTKTKHNSNKELVGQGIGNMIVALIGGIPGAGATMRTLVNINSGGRTRLSGMIHALMLLMILLVLGEYASRIPMAVLAGILITVGIGIIDYKGLKHIFDVPATDVVVMFIVMGMTVFVDLLQAVLVGLILASVLFMKKMGEINEQKSYAGSLEDSKDWVRWPDEKELPPELLKNVYIKHLYGPMFFGFTSHFQDMVREVPDVKVVILRMRHVPYMDQTGLYAIEDTVLYLESKGIKVVITGLQSQPADMLRRINLVPHLIPEEHLFPSFKECVAWLREL